MRRQGRAISYAIRLGDGDAAFVVMVRIFCWDVARNVTENGLSGCDEISARFLKTDIL